MGGVIHGFGDRGVGPRSGVQCLHKRSKPARRTSPCFLSSCSTAILGLVIDRVIGSGSDQKRDALVTIQNIPLPSRTRARSVPGVTQYPLGFLGTLRGMPSTSIQNPKHFSFPECHSVVILSRNPATDSTGQQGAVKTLITVQAPVFSAIPFLFNP